MSTQAIKEAKRQNSRDFLDTGIRESNAKVLLRMFRTGDVVTHDSFREEVGSPSADIRTAASELFCKWGFDFDNDELGYWLKDNLQFPTLFAVTKKMRDRYYETEHWQSVRDRRREIDNWRCIRCGFEGQQEWDEGWDEDEEHLEVHHFNYDNLFDENPLEDLGTFCSRHHKDIHKHSRIAFPQGLPIEKASLLLEEPEEWPLWTMPEMPRPTLTLEMF